MTSAIDPANPTAGTATTASVRANFTAAKSEIEALQTDKVGTEAPTINNPTITGTMTAATIRTHRLRSIPTEHLQINTPDDEPNWPKEIYISTGDINTASPSVHAGSVIIWAGSSYVEGKGGSIELVPGWGTVQTAEVKILDNNWDPKIRVNLSGIGFNGHPPTQKPIVTGSRSDGSALTSLLAALDSIGLLTDDSTA